MSVWILALLFWATVFWPYFLSLLIPLVDEKWLFLHDYGIEEIWTVWGDSSLKYPWKTTDPFAAVEHRYVNTFSYLFFSWDYVVFLELTVAVCQLFLCSELWNSVAVLVTNCLKYFDFERQFSIAASSCSGGKSKLKTGKYAGLRKTQALGLNSKTAGLRNIFGGCFSQRSQSDLKKHPGKFIIKIKIKDRSDQCLDSVTLRCPFWSQVISQRFLLLF